MTCLCGATLTAEEREEGSGLCSLCQWAEEQAFLETAYEAAVTMWRERCERNTEKVKPMTVRAEQ